jgi:hypothetical protein
MMERSSAALAQQLSLKCRAGASHPVGARSPVSWQAMPVAQMQEGADKAMAAVSVIIMAARPVAVVGKMIEHQVEQLHRLQISASNIGLIAPDPDNENEPIKGRRRDASTRAHVKMIGSTKP